MNKKQMVNHCSKVIAVKKGKSHKVSIESLTMLVDYVVRTNPKASIGEQISTVNAMYIAHVDNGATLPDMEPLKNATDIDQEPLNDINKLGGIFREGLWRREW